MTAEELILILEELPESQRHLQLTCSYDGGCAYGDLFVQAHAVVDGDELRLFGID